MSTPIQQIFIKNKSNIKEAKKNPQRYQAKISELEWFIDISNPVQLYLLLQSPFTLNLDVITNVDFFLQYKKIGKIFQRGRVFEKILIFEKLFLLEEKLGDDHVFFLQKSRQTHYFQRVMWKAQLTDFNFNFQSFLSIFQQKRLLLRVKYFIHQKFITFIYFALSFK